jgi:para-aminobenzoate synthetase/4-amino-4-deoxychorismate lyase
MRWDPTNGFRHLQRHLRRLSDSAWYFDVPLDPAEVRAALNRATSGHDDPLRVRLLVDRTGWVTVESSAAPDPLGRPVRLAVDNVAVDPADPFIHHKTTNRRLYDEAGGRHPEADDVVLVNGRGEITETTIANVAVLIGGEWRTPPAASGCLPGVERAHLLDLRAIVERPVTIDELMTADGIARFNAVRGWEEAVVSTGG